MCDGQTVLVKLRDGQHLVLAQPHDDEPGDANDECDHAGDDPNVKRSEPTGESLLALYITVIRPISVPVNVAMPSQGPTAQPAPTKFVMLPA